jgi:hypothetical protein
MKLVTLTDLSMSNTIHMIIYAKQATLFLIFGDK